MSSARGGAGSRRTSRAGTPTPLPVRPRQVTYTFLFPDRTERAFRLWLAPGSLTLFRIEGPCAEERARGTAADRALVEPAAWTRLSCVQCPHCSLDSVLHPQCPPARNLVAVVDCFKADISYENCVCHVRTDAREYAKRSSLFEGLSSLIGLTMATSGCPHLDMLRPMAYTHLPFANVGESFVRSLGTYLVAQFLRQRTGLPPDWSLERLGALYEAVSTVNRAFMGRLRCIDGISDVSLNALVSLDCFAVFTAFSLEQSSLSELRAVFAPYLERDLVHDVEPGVRPSAAEVWGPGDDL